MKSIKRYILSSLIILNLFITNVNAAQEATKKESINLCNFLITCINTNPGIKKLGYSIQGLSLYYIKLLQKHNLKSIKEIIELAQFTDDFIKLNNLTMACIDHNPNSLIKLKSGFKYKFGINNKMSLWEKIITTAKTFWNWLPFSKKRDNPEFKPFELFYHTSSKKAKIATRGVTYSKAVIEAHMLPRGSALITDSGNLKSSGITSIVHAASGSMTSRAAEFKPTSTGIKNSITNSIELARLNGHHSIAIPMIGGGIFLNSIGKTKQENADDIVESALKNSHNISIKFVGYGDNDTKIFENSLKKFKPSYPKAKASVLNGSITNFKLHGATAIVNASNMEVLCGGGLAGFICKKYGSSDQLDKQSTDLINEYNLNLAMFFD